MPGVRARLENGDVQWIAGDGVFSYSSAHLANLHNAPQVLLMNELGLASFAPETGEELWLHDWPLGGGSARIVQPAVIGSDIVVTTGIDGLTTLASRFGEPLGLPIDLRGVENVPVGWLPDPGLLVAAYPDGCSEGAAADLWVVTWDDSGTARGELLVRGVTDPAVRSQLPEPPPPPDENFEGFA